MIKISYHMAPKKRTSRPIAGGGSAGAAGAGTGAGAGAGVGAAHGAASGSSADGSVLSYADLLAIIPIIFHPFLFRKLMEKKCIEIFADKKLRKYFDDLISSFKFKSEYGISKMDDLKQITKLFKKIDEIDEQIKFDGWEYIPYGVDPEDGRSFEEKIRTEEEEKNKRKINDLYDSCSSILSLAIKYRSDVLGIDYLTFTLLVVAYMIKGEMFDFEIVDGKITRFELKKNTLFEKMFSFMEKKMWSSMCL